MGRPVLAAMLAVAPAKPFFAGDLSAMAGNPVTPDTLRLDDLLFLQ